MGLMGTAWPTTFSANPWVAFSQIGMANPFLSSFANAAETMSRAMEVRAPEPRQDNGAAGRVTLVDAAYRGAGGYAVPHAIKITAEVPVASLATLWGWPFAMQRFA
jgi:hypothetical protein